jgi:transcriptional antiterminator
LTALERHYTVKEIAEIWNLSDDTVRRIFQDLPGVLKVGSGSMLRKKRGYVTLRIPESVVEWVHQEKTE